MIYFRFVNIMNPKSVQQIGESLDVRGTGFSSLPRLKSSHLPSIQTGCVDKLYSNSLGNTACSIGVKRPECKAHFISKYCTGVLISL
jgi:hypothetical protein